MKLADGALDEWAFQDAVYAVKQAALEREMEPVKLKAGEESVEYKKLAADKLKMQADFIASRKGMEEGLYKAEKFLSGSRKVLELDEFQTLTEFFGKKTALYKAAMLAKKAVTIGEIMMSVPEQMASNAVTAADITKFFSFWGRPRQPSAPPR